jgi:hypothetical protein
MITKGHGLGGPCGESTVAGTAERVTRRTLIRRSGTVALGAAAVWSAPSIRTSALNAESAGTPPPNPQVHSQSQTAGESATVPAGASTDTNRSSSGTLPLTGIDPKPLLITGGAAIAAGAALTAIVHDPEPSRGDP